MPNQTIRKTVRRKEDRVRSAVAPVLSAIALIVAVVGSGTTLANRRATEAAVCFTIAYAEAQAENAQTPAGRQELKDLAHNMRSTGIGCGR